jgi:prepilin-type N-terminal cleavage/methylation domain-containing protein
MNKKGMTLVELIVVFAIIAIMATLMAPGIGKWLPRYRLRSATRDIVSTMRGAQMKAVSTRLQYQVDFTVGSNSYVLQHNSGGLVFTDGSVQTAPSGIVVNNNFVGGIATFNPDSTCGTGSVTLSYQKGGITQAQKKIVLSAGTGRAKIID